MQMTMQQLLLIELEREAVATRKMLSRLPQEHFGWKPHEKSFSLLQLALHIAEMVGWVGVTVQTEKLDFAETPYIPPQASSTAELLQFFEENLNNSILALRNVTDEDLTVLWKMCNGDTIYFEMPRHVALRSMVLNHTYHHRGQLSVYMRQLGIPLPSVYGPSADER